MNGRTHGDYHIVSGTSSQLSLLLQGALVRYAASSKDFSIEVTGSSFEIRSGLRYRYDIGLLNAGGIELLGTLFGLPADQERLESRTIELSFFWQV